MGRRASVPAAPWAAAQPPWSRPPPNRRWAVAMQQAVLLSGAQRTTNSGQRTDGAYWWGCLGLPPLLRSAFLPLSYPPPSLHPLLALRNLSLHNAFPSLAHAGRRRGRGGGGGVGTSKGGAVPSPRLRGPSEVSSACFQEGDPLTALPLQWGRGWGHVCG